MQTTGRANDRLGGAGHAPRSIEADPALRRGDSVRVDVVVRTRKVGHFFPGGTVDAFDTWVELKAVDDKGTDDVLERQGRVTTVRGRSRKARTSIARCRWTSTAIRSTNAMPGRRAPWCMCT